MFQKGCERVDFNRIELMKKMKFKKFTHVLVGLLFIACSPQKQEMPNILWISCEDISPAWGCYGDAQASTPFIDHLAAGGYVYTQAFSNAPTLCDSCA